MCNGSKREILGKDPEIENLRGYQIEGRKCHGGIRQTGKKLGQNTRERERGVGRAACTEAAEGREREGVGCGMWDVGCGMGDG